MFIELYIKGDTTLKNLGKFYKNHENFKKIMKILKKS
jgi:hypothetical protein